MVFVIVMVIIVLYLMSTKTYKGIKQMEDLDKEIKERDSDRRKL